MEPEIRSYPVLPGDIFLLCSDGLNDMVEDEEIGLTLQTLSANLELAATQLIQMANDNGGPRQRVRDPGQGPARLRRPPRLVVPLPGLVEMIFR